jgi:CHAD domain-containing protein
MATAQAEIERKFEVPDGASSPDLTGVGPVASVGQPTEADLVATYFDTRSLRLARHGATLRRRTGGHDAGWHLKLPRGGDERTEVTTPLSGDHDDVPADLRAMVTGRVAHQTLEPVATIRTTRIERELRDERGRRLATVADDHVVARRSRGDSVALIEWREIEVELDGGDTELLDAVTERFEQAGLSRSADRSKLHRVLGDDLRPPVREASSKAAAAILDHLAEQVEAIITGDARVRAEEDVAVHDMRVATRRLRSALATFRPFLDRRQTEPLRDEVRWLGQELGSLRDAEVLAARLRAAVDDEPPELVLGPVATRVDVELRARERAAREELLVALDSDRYLDLLEDLDDLVEHPPWSPLHRPSRSRVRKRVAHAFGRMDDRADAVPDDPGEERAHALHELRKAAKRARYAAEAVVPLFGVDAGRAATRAEDLQDVLGEHQDSIRSQEVLRQLGVTAHLSGENGFTFGLLLGAERQRADLADRDHDEVLHRTQTLKARAWLEG